MKKSRKTDATDPRCPITVIKGILLTRYHGSDDNRATYASPMRIWGSLLLYWRQMISDHTVTKKSNKIYSLKRQVSYYGQHGC